MANLIHPTPQFGFRSAAVNHSPSPLGFGFGLSPAASLPGWQPQAMQTASASCLPSHSILSPLHTPLLQKSAQKRRHDNADDDRDDAMDRSPSPERRPIKRIAQKRARVTESLVSEEASQAEKENKTLGNKSNDGVDIGMLLASLPPQSLLPILTSLLSENPSLKPMIMSLIPRPTLHTALTALNQAAKKLREAYPYSNFSATSFSQQSATTSFGFGNSAPGASRAGVGVSSNLHISEFGRPLQTPAPSSGMRDTYVISRLRPHISEFIATSFSYMPYFSFSETTESQTIIPGKERLFAHPSETFDYLSTLTNHLLSQPPLAQSSLVPLLLPRLLKEWTAWVNRVDSYVNKEARMIGMEVAQNWIRTLDGFTGAKVHCADNELDHGFKVIRDKWISMVGWLVGRREVHQMDDEEEL